MSPEIDDARQSDGVTNVINSVRRNVESSVLWDITVFDLWAVTRSVASGLTVSGRIKVHHF
jgi:hypothetical protein